jgi:hypothetical protein
VQGTRRLFVLLQGESEGREAAARVARGLAPQGPSRIADVLGSLVARALPDRLALLAELDVTSRLQMVVRLLGLMLDAAEKAATGGAAPRGRSRRSGGTGSTRAGSGSRGLRLPPGLSGSAAGDDQGDEEDEEEDSKRELAHLMDKLRVSKLRGSEDRYCLCCTAVLCLYCTTPSECCWRNALPFGCVLPSRVACGRWQVHPWTMHARGLVILCSCSCCSRALLL